MTDLTKCILSLACVLTALGCSTDRPGSIVQTTPPSSAELKSFRIDGRVVTPGTYQWTGRLTLGQAIAKAGGLKRYAERRVYVYRDPGGFPPGTRVYNHKFNTHGRDRATPDYDLQMKDGDTIYVVPQMR